MSNPTRTPQEIEDYASENGCVVWIRSLGDSYRAGGEIIIVPEDEAPEEKGRWGKWASELTGVEIKRLPLDGFRGTGYHGRGRHYSVWVIRKGGEYRACSLGDYYQSPESERISFGHEGESNWLGFTRSKDTRSDLAAAFEAVGL